VLEAGQAFGISTGAMVPEGADAVVRVEDTVAGEGVVEILASVEPGRDIRRAGEDIRGGETVLRRGTVLGPAELGVLASVGVADASCTRRPTVAVLTTGDELREPGEELGPGAIRNTNAYAVPALAERSGGELQLVESVGDEAASTRDAIARALEADVAVICGGVSVGEHDHVRPALEELGCEQRFWGVALRPGRPTWFGTSADGGLVFGLPGNPVSAVVTFTLFARPALLALQGTDPARPRTTAILDEGYEKRTGRAHALRCSLELAADGWHARLTREAQGSHVLTSMLGADALAIIPAEAEAIAPGERVEVELLPGVASGL
jgi:molybdopterin molybdotransferase